MASAMAAAWSDSFLVRRVDRVAALKASDRAVQGRADSLRRAGVTAFTQRGPAAAIALWNRALPAYRMVADTAGLGATFDNIGAGLIELGRLDSAEHYLTRARRMAVRAGDLRVQAAVTSRLADIAAERGATVAAKDGYTQSLALKQRIGDDRGVAADLNNLGLLAQDAGDNVEARRQFEAALALNRAGGRPEVAATNLVNLASLAAVEGDFGTAVSFYRDALETWRRRGDEAEVAIALQGLAQLEMRRGDYPAARRFLLEASTLTERTGSVEDRILVRRALADVLAAAGDLQGALDQVSAAQALADSPDGTTRARSALALTRADLALRMNTLPDADRWYAEAAQLARSGRDQVTQGEAQQGRGLLALAMEEEARATSLLIAALRSQRAASNARGAALTRIALGQAAWLRNDTAAARLQLKQAVAELDRLKDPVAAAEALAEAGKVEYQARSLPLAESHFRAGLRRLEGRQSPETMGRLRAGLGLVLRDRGDLNGAARELRAAIDALDAPSRTLALAERRSAFRSDKWEVYGQLALIERARGLENAAFEVSERQRAREMHEILARGRVEAGEASADLVSREQDLRRRIGELSREASPVRSEPVRGTELSLGSPARPSLLQAQDQYADLLLQLRERAPRHAEVVASKVASWRQVSQRLTPEQAFITYLVGDSTTLAFIITRDTLTSVDLAVGQRELARLIELNRGTLDRGKADMPWRGPLRSLDEFLITPLEESGALRGKSELVIAPHAELHYLPFAALLSAGSQPRYLAERYRIAVTPSASVWIALGERTTERARAGTIALAPRPDALPASRNEVAAVARLVGRDARVRIGPMAREDGFKREASEQRVIHLATYGVLNKNNPLFSFVELTAGGGDDGRLEVHEVFGLRLSADLVVLSACQTGLGSGALADVPPGDDWVGLTRAFLHAGAGAVVATLWQVDDWATAVMMERFYQAMAGGAEPVRALAEAQQAMAKDPATAHPWYWAGFVIAKGSDRAGGEQSKWARPSQGPTDGSKRDP
jgi:CHAT domain-containing protein